MDQLRLILLIVGVVLIAGIFVFELVRKRAHERRRAQIVEHLDGKERSLYEGESLLGDIGRVDASASARPSPGRRSRDRVPDDDEMQAAALAEYDIDEDFAGEAQEVITQSPKPPADEPPAAREPAANVDDHGLARLSGLAARRDAPEQLDLAGLDLSALPRESDASAARRAGAAAASGGQSGRRRPALGDEEELHIIMTVMAKGGERFTGQALRDALERADLYHGEMNIFHRHEQPKDPTTPTLFSVANVLAPGYFDPGRMETLSSPGIAVFMRLPGPEHPSDAFQQMLDAAKTVAEDLDGTLCDESRSTLTPQSINHLRERIADFGRRQMLKA